MQSIRELVWQGGLNVQITLDHSFDLVPLNETFDAYRVLNVRLHRERYFWHYMDGILGQLNRIFPHLESRADFMKWFEFEGFPLPWNHPVGVLFDACYRGPNVDQIEDAPSVRTPLHLINVWQITLKQGNEWPATIVPFATLDSMKSYWMHKWKQVCYILNGNSRKMMELSPIDVNNFWESISNDGIAPFDELASKIIAPSKAASRKHLPLIIHEVTSKSGHRFSQPMIDLKDYETLNELVVEVLKYDVDRIIVFAQGIRLPLESLLYEMYIRFMSIDGYLHLVVKT